MTGADGSALTSTVTKTQWDWGDGLTDTFTNPAPPPAPVVESHPYAVAGTYLVFVKATAPAGTASNSTTIKIP
jgi:hypothetical protein